MSLQKYGVLKGTIVDKQGSIEAVQNNPGGKPHYQIKVEADGVFYRIAVNVKSDQKPDNLQVFRSENYQHPVLDQLDAFEIGYTPLKSTSSSGALDFIRGNLFDMDQMVILPATDETSGNDLNDIFNVYVEQAMKTRGALVYAFGSKWSDTNSDPYFDFKPGNGIHDIHMNQGNTGAHARDNGVYQDGALFIYYPDEKRWLAMFLKFQSQHVHTDDLTAKAMVKTKDELPEVLTPVVISAAFVKHNQVYLFNTSEEPVNMNGWSVIDNGGLKDALPEMTLKGGDVFKCTLSGTGAQFHDQGGTLTLLNPEGLKVSGVSYTSDMIRKNKVIRF